MNNIWSKNKYINLIGNILLFLIAINFMHVGQLILPFLCLLLFIENKFKFKVNNIKIFVLLCLFAITFCAFSYKLGLYCFVTFCLPMAYYVGSNIYEPNIEKIKNVIYIIAFGMASHLVLNFLMELSWWHDNLSYMFNKPSHYDIWLEILSLFGYETDAKIRPTGTSMNYYFILSTIYYLVNYEKDKVIKIIGILLFVLSSIYCVALARRTTLLLAIMIITFCVLFDIAFIKKKLNYKILVLFFAIICLLLAIYFANIFGAKDVVNNLMIFNRLNDKGLQNDRLYALIESIKLYPHHLWGGQEISTINGFQIHDLWGDIYDYAGIVPYILIITYSIYVLIKFINLIKNKKYNNDNKMLTICLFVCIASLMFVEPVLTGASLFLLLSIIIFATIE